MTCATIGPSPCTRAVRTVVVTSPVGAAPFWALTVATTVACVVRRTTCGSIVTDVVERTAFAAGTVVLVVAPTFPTLSTARCSTVVAAAPTCTGAV